MTLIRFLILAFLLSSCDGSPSPVIAQSAVAMPDTYSADVATGILEAGGNAVDASIAAAFSLAVTLPEAGNIGGGGFMLVHMDGESTFIDYRETAPLQAHRDMYLDEQGEVIPRSSLIGHRAAAVPGTVAGMWLAHQRYGTLPWAELLAPAIALAREGFTVPKELADYAAEIVPWHDGAVDFEGRFGKLRAGEVFRQEDLALTLERIASHGENDFYRGETARLIVDEMNRGGGLITAEDLDRYRAVVREPLRANWRGREVLSAPPPSSGGFAVIQLLKIKDFLSHEFAGVPHNSPQYIHLVAEIEKRVFADRAEYLGDPDYVDVPLDRLLSDEYLRMRANEVNSDVMSEFKEIAPGLESIDTTHFSIMDEYGNAVSNTYTLNWTFGSGVVVGGAGFLLNDEMDDFSAKPNTPNIFGVVGNTANEIQPGKRMLSSMSPTILLQDGEVELVIGTPGGSTIFTSVFQNIISIYDFGMSPGEAAGASRFHHQLLPADLITYSPSVPLPNATISALGDRGYRVLPHDWEFGNLQIILRRKDELQAASDPRGRGEARVIMRAIKH
ncbi:MAG: gamma-glutamyltransferase [Gammaproteobacteria bacterium]|nr:gamma-glutamyltransferase [Gammaproteobacteria bacterium]